jgi:hypothetical protein
MSYERLAYDDHDSTVKMAIDCTACASQMGLPERPDSVELFATAPSIEYQDFVEQARKPEITVTDATAYLASQMHLHLH